MQSRFHAKDFLAVGHSLGTLVVVLGLLMLLSAALGLACGEVSCAVDFAASAGFCLLAGALLRICPPVRLNRRSSILLCGVALFAVPMLAAIPLFLTGGYGSYFDALFDAVSGVTTTGVTLSEDVDHLANTQVTWHVVLALTGSIGIILITLHLGFFGDGGYTARQNANARRSTHASNLRSTSRYVWVVTATAVAAGTLVCTVYGLRAGWPLGEAALNGFWLAGNAFSTSSFVPHTSSLIFYHSEELDFFLLILMFMGALNFGIYALALRGRLRESRRNSELRAYLIWVAVLVVLVVIALCREGLFTSIDSLLNIGVFQVVAASTTCGMQTVYPAQLGTTFIDGALILVMAAAFVGATSCSCSGGIKMFRMLQLMRWFFYSIKRTLLPDRVQVRVRYEHFGRRDMDPEKTMLAMSVTVLYVCTAALGAVFFIAHGYNALQSVAESASYVSNTGFTTGITSASMSLDLKIIAMVQMWAGRLEFIVLFAALFGLAFSLLPKRVALFGTQLRGNVRDRLAERELVRRVRNRVNGASHHVGAVLLALVLVAGCVGTPALSAQAAPSGDEVTAAEEADGASDESAATEASDEALAGDDRDAVAAPSAADDLPDLDLSVNYRSVTAAELIAATDRSDGAYVEIEGEVVGRPIDAGDDRMWVNVRSGGAVIGVFMSDEQAQLITTHGGYNTTGDIVTVRAVFNLACPAHAGELDVHASQVAVSQPGATAQIAPDWLRLRRGAGCAGVAVVILLTCWLLRRRNRRLRSRR